MRSLTSSSSSSGVGLALLAACLLGSLAACSGPPVPPPSVPSGEPDPVTAFEGARVIVGDASAPIENGVLVVSGNKFLAVGPAGEVTVPPGALRVTLAGKTVMPAIVDTHTCGSDPLDDRSH